MKRELTQINAKSPRTPNVFIVAVEKYSVGVMDERFKKSSLVGSSFVTKVSKRYQTTIANFLRITNIFYVMPVTEKIQIIENRSDCQAQVTFPKPNNQNEKRVRKEMKSALSNIFKIAMVAIVSMSVAFAQGTPKLDLQMDEQKVNLSAEEKRDDSKISYLPGDTLLYTITASNVGDGLMTNPEIVDPIPMGVTYIANSATGQQANISYSIDQGRSYMAWPVTYTVRNAQGALIEHNATPDMITHVKWNILKDMNPGDASILKFSVEVSK